MNFLSFASGLNLGVAIINAANLADGYYDDLGLKLASIGVSLAVAAFLAVLAVWESR